MSVDRLITWQYEYVNDYIWTDLLLVGAEPVRAVGSVLFDGKLVGTAETPAPHPVLDGRRRGSPTGPRQ